MGLPRHKELSRVSDAISPISDNEGGDRGGGRDGHVVESTFLIVKSKTLCQCFVKGFS